MQLLIKWLTTKLNLSTEQAISAITRAHRSYSYKPLQKTIEQLIGHPLSPDLVSEMKRIQRFEQKIFYQVEFFEQEVDEALVNRMIYLIDSLVPLSLCRRDGLIPIAYYNSKSNLTLEHPTVLVVTSSPGYPFATDEVNRQLKPLGIAVKRLGILQEDYYLLWKKYWEKIDLDPLNSQRSQESCNKSDLALSKDRQALKRAYESDILVVHPLIKRASSGWRQLQRFELKILYGVPCLELNWENVPNHLFDLIETLIPLKVCQEYHVIPSVMQRDENSSVFPVAMVNPDDLRAQDFIERYFKPSQKVFQRFVITREDFEQAINYYAKHQDLKKQKQALQKLYEREPIPKVTRGDRSLCQARPKFSCRRIWNWLLKNLYPFRAFH